MCNPNKNKELKGAKNVSFHIISEKICLFHLSQMLFFLLIRKGHAGFGHLV